LYTRKLTDATTHDYETLTGELRSGERLIAMFRVSKYTGKHPDSSVETQVVADIDTYKTIQLNAARGTISDVKFYASTSLG
jgi:hypothetical protein